MEGPSRLGNHPSSHKCRSQDAGDSQPDRALAGEPKALSWTPSGSVRPPSPRFARSLPQGGRRREGGREGEGGKEGGRTGRESRKVSLVLPGVGQGGEGWRVRGSSRLAGYRLGGDGWRGGCAARDNSWLGNSDSSLSEMLKRGTHGGVERYLRGRSESNSHGLQSSGEAGIGGVCGWGQGRKVCEAKSFHTGGMLKALRGRTDSLI